MCFWDLEKIPDLICVRYRKNVLNCIIIVVNIKKGMK